MCDCGLDVVQQQYRHVARDTAANQDALDDRFLTVSGKLVRGDLPAPHANSIRQIEKRKTGGIWVAQLVANRRQRTAAAVHHFYSAELGEAVCQELRRVRTFLLR